MFQIFKSLLVWVLLYYKQISKGGDPMNIMVREFAQVNFFVIWFVVVTGFAFIKLVKNRLQ